MAMSGGSGRKTVLDLLNQYKDTQARMTRAIGIYARELDACLTEMTSIREEMAAMFGYELPQLPASPYPGDARHSVLETDVNSPYPPVHNSGSFPALS